MIADTTHGKVQGFEKFGCLQFRGIPFAAPPTGANRWRVPRPAVPWDGVRDCTTFSAICPQNAGTMEQLGGARAPVLAMDEDCLTLNVFTPAVDDSKRPVMVWIHGGAFSTGSGRLPWYYGHNFARDGVVVVTINYRVNAFGFLHLRDLFGDEFADSGTLGIADQIAALQWVRENIENFGGDARNVTIFGESAGGMSVGTLLGSPSATGLFRKAIPQSGAAHSSHTAERANHVTRALIAAAGVRAGDVEALMALETEKILAAVQIVDTAATSEGGLDGDEQADGGLPFQPVVGGAVVPEPPIDAIRGGSSSNVPALVGTNLEEWKLFTLGVRPEARLARVHRPLRNLCERAGRSVDELIAGYGDGLSELDLRNAIETDRIFRIPAIRLAEAQAANDAPVWMYRFDWKSPAFGGRVGAAHALEIPFVFDNLGAPGVDAFTGGNAPQELATRMHAAWVAFAKTGDPNTAELPEWPGYDSDRRATMLLDAECRIEDDPGAETRMVWDGVL